MKKTKKYYIELTDEQKERLFPLFDKVAQEYEKGTPGMLIAQIHYTGRDAVAVCAFVEFETAKKLSLAIKGKEPKTVTEKHALNALKKARTK